MQAGPATMRPVPNRPGTAQRSRPGHAGGAAVPPGDRRTRPLSSNSGAIAGSPLPNAWAACQPGHSAVAAADPSARSGDAAAAGYPSRSATATASSSGPSRGVLAGGAAGRPGSSSQGRGRGASKDSASTTGTSGGASGSSLRGNSRGLGRPSRPSTAAPTRPKTTTVVGPSTGAPVRVDGKKPSSRKVVPAEPEIVLANAADEVFGWSPLHHAAESGGLEDLSALCADHRVKLCVPCRCGNGPLHVAARAGHAAAAGFLIAKKADVHSLNDNLWTPLLVSAINGHADVARLLLDALADPRGVDDRGRTACMWGAHHGHVSIVTLLLPTSDLWQRDFDGVQLCGHAAEHLELSAQVTALVRVNRCLCDGAKRNDLDMVQQALLAGAQVDHLDQEGWRPIMWAVMHDTLDLIHLLLRFGASRACDEANAVHFEQLGKKHSALLSVLRDARYADEQMLASARAGRWSDVQAKLQCLSNADTFDRESLESPLMWAAAQGSVRGLELLLVVRSSLEKRDLLGRTALHHAVESGQAAAVCLLREYGADVNVKSHIGDSPMHLAVRSNDPSTMQVLLLARASIEEVDLEGQTPALSAARHGCPKAMKVLYAYQADLSARDARGLSPLAVAADRGHADVARLLLRKPVAPPAISARPSPTKALSGQVACPTPDVGSEEAVCEDAHQVKLFSAAVQERARVIEQLPEDSAGKALLTGQDGAGEVPLHAAARSDSMEIVRLLLKHKAQVDAQDYSGNTALMVSAAKGHHHVVRQLMEASAYLEKCNNQKRTAMHIAQGFEVRELLRRANLRKKIGFDAVVRTALKKVPSESYGCDDIVLGQQRRLLLEGLPVHLGPGLLEGHVRALLRRLGAGEVDDVEIEVAVFTGKATGRAVVDCHEACNVECLGDELCSTNVRIRPWGGPLRNADLGI